MESTRETSEQIVGKSRIRFCGIPNMWSGLWNRKLEKKCE